MIRTKRAYDPPSMSDGDRYLIDRLWPRGLTREALQLTAWLKDIAPSEELRRWYGHVPAKFPEFRRRYRAELSQQSDIVAELRRKAARSTITLIYGAREGRFANAAVLAELLAEAPADSASSPRGRRAVPSRSRRGEPGRRTRARGDPARLAALARGEPHQDLAFDDRESLGKRRLREPHPLG